MTTSTDPLTTNRPVGHPALRPFLLVDATITAVNGALYLAAAGWLSELFGAGSGLLRGLGGFLLLVGAAVAWLATRRPVPRAGLVLLVLLNAGWVAASLVYAVRADLTPVGLGWDVLQAAVVAAFAAGQAWFARRG